MLARHHDLRAHSCDDNESARNIIKVSSEGLDVNGEANDNFFVQVVSPQAQEAVPPLPLTMNEEERWNLWRPVDNLLDKLFPADLFGAPQREQERAQGQREELMCDNEEEEGGHKVVMDSFTLVPDYEQRSEGAGLSQGEQALLEGVVRGKAKEDAALRALVSKLHQHNEELLRSNARLKERAGELERENRQMREKVVSFREEMEKSFIHGNTLNNAHAGNTVNGNVFLSPLEGLLDPESQARQVLLRSRSPPIRSPSPDIHEYIRSLERRVEQQQQKLDDWNAFYKGLNKSQLKSQDKGPL